MIQTKIKVGSYNQTIDFWIDFNTGKEMLMDSECSSCCSTKQMFNSSIPGVNFSDQAP